MVTPTRRTRHLFVITPVITFHLFESTQVICVGVCVNWERWLVTYQWLWLLLMTLTLSSNQVALLRFLRVNKDAES